MSTTLIYAFFFTSGFAALLYQVVWLKYLNLLFGSTTYATAAVVAAFMFGLSFGSRVSTKYEWLYKSSLKNYGLMEIGVGLFSSAQNKHKFFFHPELTYLHAQVP